MFCIFVLLSTVYGSKGKKCFLAGGSTLSDLHQALVDYLPVLLELTKDGNILLCVYRLKDLFGFRDLF